MVLRSPVDRAFSQYLHVLSDGHYTGSFRSYVYESLNRNSDRLSVFYPFLEMGFYAEQVCRYLRFFPAEQVGIWFYEDLISSPAQFLRQIFSFLYVDAGFEPDRSRRYNQPRVVAQMDAADRALLLDIYRGDIFRLQDLVHRDLRTWLT